MVRCRLLDSELEEIKSSYSFIAHLHLFMRSNEFPFYKAIAVSSKRPSLIRNESFRIVRKWFSNFQFLWAKTNRGQKCFIKFKVQKSNPEVLRLALIGACPSFSFHCFFWIECFYFLEYLLQEHWISMEIFRNLIYLTFRMVSAYKLKCCKMLEWFFSELVLKKRRLPCWCERVEFKWFFNCSGWDFRTKKKNRRRST